MIKSRTIFIGDVHGCFDELKLLLNKLCIHQNDKVYFVGDIINKGPKSYKVLNFIYKNKEQFKCVKGNNELTFIKLLNNKIKSNNTLKEFEILKEKIILNNKKYLLDYIEKLPLYIEENEFLLLHGGLIPNKTFSEHTDEEITELREYNGELWYKQYKGNKKIIYGHNAKDGLQICEKTIGLDSGCVYGKTLVAYILESGEIVSQNALKTYRIPGRKKSFLQKLFGI